MDDKRRYFGGSRKIRTSKAARMWKGKNRTLAEIARMEDVPYSTLYGRLSEGLPLEVAVRRKT